MLSPARAIALRATVRGSLLGSSLLAPLPGQVRRYTPHRQKQQQQQVTHQPGQTPDNITISWTHQHILLQHRDRQNSTLPPRRLHAATLRDECGCPTCRDESSGNKTFASVEIPPEIRIAGVRATEEGLRIQFANDVVRFEGRAHETVVPWERVERVVSASSYCSASPSASVSSSASASVAASPHGRRPNSLFHRKQALLARTGVQYWDASTLSSQIRKIDYHAFMAPSSSSSSYPPAFWDVLITLLRLGIVYLTHVPRHESSLTNIINRIANLRETFYGRTFDVRAKPRAENVAYTSGYLGLHQDLCYLAPPPMIQVLHCMDNSCEGGESLFSDGERVGRLLWPFVRGGRKSRMGVLAEHAVPYQYDKHGYYYRAERSVLRREADGSFGGVYWSPPFQGRYEQQEYGGEEEEVDLKRWIPAARVFEGLINDPGAVYQYKMQEGECVLFDNLRVLHGRNAFDAAHRGGSRWLRGGYIAAEDFLSRAAYIPGERADEHRGKGDLWTPEGAEEELRVGDWWPDVVRRVREVDEADEAVEV
ncbi:hypothetical protein E4U56_008101 [Claviceps arundinis]|uniref:Gamma-butyrobetaine dioxygenase n=1 Tax=Claviceps arundinis TaxID=1623583 RepID=A0A9P7SPQ4_9HYPO|nr:hypothetical protein E4U56_008101 [Claviceps arundinis]